MINNVILLAGIAAIAGPMGYMVGGSASPVIGVALPAIFGLVVTAVGLFQPSFPSKEQLALFSSLQENSSLSSYLESLQKNQARAPLRVGLALLTFGVIYLAGTILGTTARTHQWFAPEQGAVAPPEFPWASAAKPTTVGSALEWIELQERLLQRGYSSSDIAELYSIQISEWDDARKEKKRLEELSSKSGSAPIPLVDWYQATRPSTRPWPQLPLPKPSDPSDPFKYERPWLFDKFNRISPTPSMPNRDR